MRSFLAALISVFLVFPLFLFALSVIGLSTWALDRSFYAEILSDLRLYQIPEAVSAATHVRVELPGNSSLSIRVSPRALKPILSSQYMRTQALAALASVFDFLEGTTRAPDPTLDLAPVKNALRGKEGKQFALALVEDLPVGGSAGQFKVSAGRLPESRPASLSVEQAAAIVVAGLPTFASAIPDRIRLSDYSEWQVWEAQRLGRQRFPVFRGVILADIILTALGGALWVAAAFLGGTDSRQRLQWLGWSLFAPAAAVFLVGLFFTLSLLSQGMRLGLAAAQLQSMGFDAGFGAAILNAVQIAVRRIGVSFLAAGAIAAGASLALLGTSWSLPKGRPDRLTDGAPPGENLNAATGRLSP